ncbi:MAG: TonB-dependent receptor [Hyphomicrobiaceae bacterium]
MSGLATWPALAQQGQQLPAITIPAQTVTPSPATAGEAPSAADAPDAALIGVAQSGSEGMVPATRLAAEPIYRTGELLEVMPGLVVTQHSGEGKANQYFLRGFNLDHGTDLAITVNGMPVNMRTHGHGQGYADTNFLIPELMQSLVYRKGPYFTAEGDFASAGAIHLDVADRLEKNLAQVEFGSFGHRRAVTAMTVPAGAGTILAAGEIVRFDGPWDRPDDLRKLNGVLRYSQGSRDNGFAITGMAYSGRWYATDQIPARAITDGLIDRYGTLDPTDGGRSDRFSLSARWAQTSGGVATRASAYVVRSELELFNNFTYVLNDPVNGDQFKQTDGRLIAGAEVSRTYSGMLSGVASATTVGLQTRFDDIRVGLFNTAQRSVLSTVRDDRVREASVGIYAENTLRWTSWLRSTAGLRGDLYATDVDSNLSVNSGSDRDGIVSPKFGLVLGPWARTELYLNAGTGFHSNDARGTVISVDPVSGAPADRVPFLVRSKGAEVGVRSAAVPGVSTTFAAFVLDFDSEIVFVGDAGTTEASRPSRRLGLEYTLRAALSSWLTFELDAAYTRARFLTDDPSAPGRFIPGATEGVVAAGLSFDNVLGGWFGGLRVRYFGPRPLIEDNSTRSKSSTPVSARLGYRFADGLSLRLDAFNLFDQKASQIDYFYASRLPGEPGAVDDIHFHPLEPRSVRVSLTKRW